MAVRYLKQAVKTSSTDESATEKIVMEMLEELESKGKSAARAYSEKLDHYTGEIVVGRGSIEAAQNQLTQQLKDDIAFAHE